MRFWLQNNQFLKLHRFLNKCHHFSVTRSQMWWSIETPETKPKRAPSLSPQNPEKYKGKKEIKHFIKNIFPQNE